ncbi:MAG: cell division protein SepF [Lachnospirales bacterium]
MAAGYFKKLGAFIIGEDFVDGKGDIIDGKEENGDTGRASEVEEGEGKVIHMSTDGSKKQGVMLLEPSNMAEAIKAATALKANDVCVISLINTGTSAESQSITDFLTGVVCALSGKITQLSEDMVMISPATVSVTGAFDEYQEKSKKSGLFR